MLTFKNYWHIIKVVGAESLKHGSPQNNELTIKAVSLLVERYGLNFCVFIN